MRRVFKTFVLGSYRIQKFMDLTLVFLSLHLHRIIEILYTFCFRKIPTVFILSKLNCHTTLRVHSSSVYYNL